MKLDYPEKLQNLLLTPRREMSVELVVQVGAVTSGAGWGGGWRGDLKGRERKEAGAGS